MLQFTMPVRGVACYAEFDMIHGQIKNPKNSLYSANLIYGKGLAEAHMKSDNLNWAGSVIDNSIIEKLKEFNIDTPKFLQPFAKLYNVPYKKNPERNKEEYAFNLIEGKLNIEAFKNAKEMIVRSFENDNKSIDNPRVQEILSNTLTFLESYKE